MGFYQQLKFSLEVTLLIVVYKIEEYNISGFLQIKLSINKVHVIHYTIYI